MHPEVWLNATWMNSTTKADNADWEDMGSSCYDLYFMVCKPNWVGPNGLNFNTTVPMPNFTPMPMGGNMTNSNSTTPSTSDYYYNVNYGMNQNSSLSANSGSAFGVSLIALALISVIALI